MIDQLITTIISYLQSRQRNRQSQLNSLFKMRNGSCFVLHHISTKHEWIRFFSFQARSAWFYWTNMYSQDTLTPSDTIHQKYIVQIVADRRVSGKWPNPTGHTYFRMITIIPTKKNRSAGTILIQWTQVWSSMQTALCSREWHKTMMWFTPVLCINHIILAQCHLQINAAQWKAAVSTCAWPTCMYIYMYIRTKTQH